MILKIRFKIGLWILIIYLIRKNDLVRGNVRVTIIIEVRLRFIDTSLYHIWWKSELAKRLQNQTNNH